MHHLTSVEDFTVADLDHIRGLATYFQQNDDWDSRIKHQGILAGHNVVIWFSEPSSRTFMLSARAAKRLGATVTGTQSGRTTSSEVKGETLADTVSVMTRNADLFVLRHPDSGASKLAARYAHCPVVNAGDGAGEHPTQALLDNLTVLSRFPGRYDLSIAFIGDNLHSRTVHSTVRWLARFAGTEYGFATRTRFISPANRMIPEAYLDELVQVGIAAECYDTLDAELLRDIDVVNIVRPQSERVKATIMNRLMPFRWSSNALAPFQLSPNLVRTLKPGAIIMHPLPRTQELPADVDNYRGSVYLTDMVDQGLYSRMALFTHLLRPSFLL